MPKSKQYGTCHICGKYGKLSFEHVPPRKAYNEKPAHMAKGEEFIRNITKANFEDIKTRIYQRGSGDYTLCEECNNDTGSWYGKSYLDWVYQAVAIIHYTSGKPTLHYPYFLFPLRVIKQIVWDSTDKYGRKVSAGIYLYQIQMDGFIATRKMVLVK